MASGIDDTRIGAVGPASTFDSTTRAVSHGRYRLRVLLGQGGMATVERAEAEIAGRIRAGVPPKTNGRSDQ